MNADKEDRKRAEALLEGEKQLPIVYQTLTRPPMANELLVAWLFRRIHYLTSEMHNAQTPELQQRLKRIRLGYYHLLKRIEDLNT